MDRRMKTAWVFLVAIGIVGILLPRPGEAEIRSEVIRYSHGGTDLQGHLYWDDAIAGKRPGVMVVHEWWGLNEYVPKRAEMLAALGYVSFAVDMYGKGKVTEHPDTAKKWMEQITANVDAWRDRALQGLDVLRSHERVAQDKMAAVGYCFGGATALQMVMQGLIWTGWSASTVPFRFPPRVRRNGSALPCSPSTGVRTDSFHGTGSRHSFTNQ